MASGARALPEALRAFRIGDPQGKYPIYSGEGAATVEGRWHRRGQEVIYASLSYATALLEKLAHYNGVLPSNQHFIEIEIPAGTSYEQCTKDSLPEWSLPDSPQARAFGSQWLEEARTAILIVPSYVAREERNVLINPRHAQAGKIRPSLEKPVWWDSRLFDRRAT
jgi:RES domain-containing protein